jgi:hypothetical protein
MGGVSCDCPNPNLIRSISQGAWPEIIRFWTRQKNVAFEGTSTALLCQARRKWIFYKQVSHKNAQRLYVHFGPF